MNAIHPRQFTDDWVDCEKNNNSPSLMSKKAASANLKWVMYSGLLVV